MGLYKRCDCPNKKAQYACEHDWWAAFKPSTDARQERNNLTKWIKRPLKNKEQAGGAFELFKTALMNGRYRKEGFDITTVALKVGAASVEDVAKRYIVSHIEGNEIKGDEANKCRRMAAFFDGRQFASITTDDIEIYLAHLRAAQTQPGKAKNGKATTRKVAKKNSKVTVNRHIARLRHLWNWAISRELVTASPFVKGETPLIKQAQEKNGRHRRLDVETDEEGRLMAAASPELQRLIVLALATGMRQGEMATLTFADLDARPGWIRLHASNTKSGKTRYVPIVKALVPVLAAMRVGADGKAKRATALVMSAADGSPVGFPEFAFRTAKRAAGIDDLRWHDLRHEFASRLAIDQKRPLPEVQLLLGHADVKTTMRYVNVVDANLGAAIEALDAYARELPPPRSTPVTHLGKKRLKLVKRA